MNKQLANLDLNLMKILKVVVQTKNTHAAAEILGISQTSVSRGMAKLRETFGDQLFLRKAHGVEPSDLAKRLAEAADEMLTPIIRVMETYNSFEPLEFTGKVSLSVNTYLLELFGEQLIAMLRHALPNATLELDYWQEHSLSEMLNGQIDYTLQLSNYSFPQDVFCHELKKTKSSLVARKGHPILSVNSNWENIHTLPIVQLYLTGVNYNKSMISELYKSKGYQANILLKTHSLKAALYTIKNSDAFCFSSTFISELDEELTSYPLPILPEQQTGLHIVGGFLQTRRSHPLNRFLQTLFEDFFNGVVQPYN